MVAPASVSTPVADSDMITLDCPHVLWLPNSFLENLLETAVLQHFEVVQAHSALVEGSTGLRPKNGLGDRQAIEDVLTGLACDLSAGDPWQRLGITPMPG